ncbi:MAG: zinc-ribbon domain-containing protein [Rhodocyclaceae bacterium]|nr:zinc-ribbon domain-containing protein [Rhodocyclaceae bacterium]
MRTRCPHCQTVFRITAEQLRARAGRVRCGRCRQVFDALANLSDAPFEGFAERAFSPAVSLPPQAPRPAMTTHDEALSSEPAASAGLQSPLAAPAALETPAAQPAKETSGAPCAWAREKDEGRGKAPAQPRAEEEAASSLPPREDDGHPARYGPAAESTPAESAPAESAPAENAFSPAPSPLAAREPTKENGAGAPLSAQEPDAAPHGADEGNAELARPDMGAAEKPAPPPRRWPWLLASIFLLLLALLQTAYYLRVELAAHVPIMREFWLAVCREIGCELPFPRKPDALKLLHTELAPFGEKRYELIASLRNAASYAIAYPHLELTLTDTRDGVLARKVFSPREWLPSEREPSQGFAAGDEFEFRLVFEAQDLAAAGYRLYLFYP